MFTTTRPPCQWAERDLRGLIDYMGRIMESLPLAYIPKWREQAYGNSWLLISLQRTNHTGPRNAVITLAASLAVSLSTTVYDLNPATLALWFVSHPAFNITQDSNRILSARANHRTPAAEAEHQRVVAASIALEQLLERLVEAGEGGGEQ